MSRPGIVLVSKFVMADSKEYQDYINYIDRDEAKVKQQLNFKRDHEDDFQIFHHYMEYMGDEEKQGELFTQHHNKLDDKQKKEMKQQFQLGQKRGSPMWQDVLSFDNAFLEEQGLYNSKTKQLDERRMKNIVRGAVKEMLQAEKMNDTTVWAAAIHHNTDNIHVHIAMIEPKPTRETVRFYDEENDMWVEQFRGNRKQNSLNKMKSKVANQMLDRSKEYNRIDALIRGAVHSKKEQRMNLTTFKRTKKLYMQALTHLPKDLRQWRYGYESVNDARPYIDEMVSIYLETNHATEMQELNQLLDEQVEISKRLYGEDSKHEAYKQTKLNDLKKRMGNAVLTEMREQIKEDRAKRFYQQKQGRPYSNFTYIPYAWERKLNINYSLMRLNNSLRKTYHDYKRERNIEEFDRMMEEK
ncbi:MobP2 family relaxase [Virgibacillus sp. Bac330]|uniref:MobP2 family relaxase n=1 Tax=Virgibacillus sp. Bac330 TaxID=2419841 RepID=UPI000EF49272|nr:MobP2 family relaxase [Virgibacillus sp. Bac330]